MNKKFQVEIASDECKGCARCVNACPVHLLIMGKTLNIMGYPAVEIAENKKCLGCGICFYTCPEPGAITVWEVTNEQ